jgi:hypothetical protein
MRASISFVPLSRRATVLMLVLFMAAVTYAQITPSDDAYVNSALPTTNYGAAVTLNLSSPADTAFIRFDLTAVPASYTGASIAKATLKLYVNSVTTAGSFNVDYVTGTWVEKTITNNLQPTIGTTIVAGVPLTTASKGKYVEVDITPAMVEWLNNAQPNDGIALVANSPLVATFDSKENTAASHAPEVDIVFAGGGTITGVTTASGSGLIGGGTSGTLNLSLLTSCSSGQVLKWNGSAWACSSAGTGTITGVTAGTDLTGGGTSGKVTLNLDITKVPQLGTANTFTGNQTVNGNLSATGTVTGSSFGIGSNLFAFGSYANDNAFLGFAGNTTMTGSGNTATGYHALLDNTAGSSNTATGDQALVSNTIGNYNTANGTNVLYSNTTGNWNTAGGNGALNKNTTGSGNTASGAGALQLNTTASNNTATGSFALLNNTTGGYNTASGNQALYSNTTASDNTANGFQTLTSNTTGEQNTADGFEALVANTSGYNNTANGASALSSNTTGYENTAVGISALYYNTFGIQNTADGVQALGLNTTGQYNTAVGVDALYSNTTGNNLTCIGYACTASAPSLSNATAIGAHAVVGASNSLVLGGSGAYAVKVGIGTTKPSNILTIAQGAGQPLSDGWATFSSRRWKTNIHTLHDALGKVEQLRGVSYDLKATGQHEVGVIAEEVGAVVPEVVTWEKNGKDAQSVDYGRLTALLIEATKEQQALIQKQQEEIVRLTRQVKTIQATLKVNGRSASAVRTVKAEGTTVRQ